MQQTAVRTLRQSSPLTAAITARAMAARYADALLHKASRKAVAIGRNYAEHAREMGEAVEKSAPFWFFKPSSSYLAAGAGPILLPRDAVVHYEVELGVVIGRTARDVPAASAMEHVAGYVCAIDLTARNWQRDAKAAGRPWSMAKGCDTFLPHSRVLPPEAIPVHPDTGVASAGLYLDVNGVRKQTGRTEDMLCTIPELIEHISAHVTLEEWDLILTGTPAGVGPLVPGDKVRAGIEGLVEVEFDAVERTAPTYATASTK